MNPRATSARIINKVIQQQRSLTQLFTELPAKQPEIGLVKALCFGVLRWYFKLGFLLQPLLSKPLKSKDGDINALLLIGLYQIIYLKTPEHVAVMQTVAAARDLAKPWATRLINAVLRNFLRQQSTILAQTNLSAVAEFAHPQWLIDAIQAAWPTRWQDILTANNQHPPLCLRVNQLQLSRDDYIKQLQAQGINNYALVPELDSAVIVETNTDIEQLPGYASGAFSVQDGAAQLAAKWLDLAPGQRVLDACAAPGGKTLHILETQPDLAAVVAIDLHAARLRKAKDNWQRLKLPDVIRWLACDVTHIDSWWDKQCFDRILLDAPCSATGVIRRHADIKLLRQPGDIVGVVKQQKLLLDSLWPLLKKNGLLLYTTCSILPTENEQVISQFLAQHADAQEKQLPAISPVTCKAGVQILTGFNNMDGFYYAALVKV